MAKGGKLLVTVQPGLVLHVWCDGTEVARVPLSIPAALGLMQDILEHVRWPK